MVPAAASTLFFPKSHLQATLEQLFTVAFPWNQDLVYTSPAQRTVKVSSRLISICRSRFWLFFFLCKAHESLELQTAWEFLQQFSKLYRLLHTLELDSV